jgi:hypothetical protein
MHEPECQGTMHGRIELGATSIVSLCIRLKMMDTVIVKRAT